MTSKFHSGQKVREKATGAVGIVDGLDERGSIIVTFAATGETRNSPWGEYTDVGKTSHIVPRFADRTLEKA